MILAALFYLAVGFGFGMFIGFLVGKAHQANEIRAEYARAFRCYPEGQS